MAPRVVGFNYGDHYLNYFVRWIPRIFWPNRPNFGIEYHRKLERAMGLNLSGPTLTILGYYQANFGYIGIIIGMFLSGICFSVIYRWFRKHSDKKGALILYSHFLVYGIISVFSYGILTGWSYYIPFYLLPAGLSYWYLHFIQKRKASTPISIGIAQIRYYQRSIKRNVPLKFQKRPDDP